MVYNGDRVFMKILKEIAAEEGMILTAVSYDWMGKIEYRGKSGFFWGYQLPGNGAASHLIAKDKTGVYELLTAANVPAVPHFLFITPEEYDYLGVKDGFSRMFALLKTYGSLVVKPNEGTGGELVARANTEGELERAVLRVLSKYRTAALSPYLEIEEEYRAVVEGGALRLAFAKKRPTVTGDGVSPLSLLAEKAFGKIPAGCEIDLAKVPEKGEKVLLSWRHNLGLGAYGERVTDRKTLDVLEKFALSAAKAIGIDFASVDVVKVDGKLQVLEINSGVMTERFASESQENYRLVKEIYRRALLRYFEKQA